MIGFLSERFDYLDLKKNILGDIPNVVQCL